MNAAWLPAVRTAEADVSRDIWLSVLRNNTLLLSLIVELGIYLYFNRMCKSSRPWAIWLKDT